MIKTHREQDPLTQIESEDLTPAAPARTWYPGNPIRLDGKAASQRSDEHSKDVSVERSSLNPECYRNSLIVDYAQGKSLFVVGEEENDDQRTNSSAKQSSQVQRIKDTFSHDAEEYNTLKRDFIPQRSTPTWTPASSSKHLPVQPSEPRPGIDLSRPLSGVRPQSYLGPPSQSLTASHLDRRTNIQSPTTSASLPIRSSMKEQREKFLTDGSGISQVSTLPNDLPGKPGGRRHSQAGEDLGYGPVRRHDTVQHIDNGGILSLEEKENLTAKALETIHEVVLEISERCRAEERLSSNSDSAINALQQISIQMAAKLESLFNTANTISHVILNVSTRQAEQDIVFQDIREIKDTLEKGLQTSATATRGVDGELVDWIQNTLQEIRDGLFRGEESGVGNFEELKAQRTAQVSSLLIVRFTID